MKFKKKTKVSSEISTASMPDIIFMLLIFFMVTTVLRTEDGLRINLPTAERIAQLKSKIHTSNIWISKDGFISIQDKIHQVEDVRWTVYEKRKNDAELTISLKADKEARMGQIVAVQNELRKADALRLNYSTLMAGD